MSQSRSAEELSNYTQNTRTVNGQALGEDVQMDNVASADKLKTARTILTETQLQALLALLT